MGIIYLLFNYNYCIIIALYDDWFFATLPFMYNICRHIPNTVTQTNSDGLTGGRSYQGKHTTCINVRHTHKTSIYGKLTHTALPDTLIYINF